MTRPTSCTGCVYDRPELYQHGALCLHPEAHRTAWWYEEQERGVEKCYEPRQKEAP